MAYVQTSLECMFKYLPMRRSRLKDPVMGLLISLHASSIAKSNLACQQPGRTTSDNSSISGGVPGGRKKLSRRLRVCGSTPSPPLEQRGLTGAPSFLSSHHPRLTHSRFCTRVHSSRLEAMQLRTVAWIRTDHCRPQARASCPSKFCGFQSEQQHPRSQ